MNQEKRILVTGGAGFIGSHLVDKLSEEGNKIFVLDNFSTGNINNLRKHFNNKNVKIIKGDIRDQNLVNKLMNHIDTVYHLAVQGLRISLYNPKFVNDVNVNGTLNLCMAALRNKVKKFVYISSSEVYGTAKEVPMNEKHPLEPTTVYGASKLTGELYVKAFYRTYKLPVTIVRPFNTYGPREHFEGPYGEVIPKFAIRIMNNLPPLIFGTGKQTRDFTYVGDIVNGILLASKSDELIGDAVNIAYGGETSVLDIANSLLKVLNRSDLKPVFCEPRPGDVMRHYADINKAKKILKFKPKLNIKEGIRNYINWFNEEGFDAKKLIKKEVAMNWKGVDPNVS